MFGDNKSTLVNATVLHSAFKQTVYRIIMYKKELQMTNGEFNMLPQMNTEKIVSNPMTGGVKFPKFPGMVLYHIPLRIFFW